MATRKNLGVEETRIQLPRLLEQAAAGKATVITRHGKPIAAIMPLDTYASAGRQQSIPHRYYRPATDHGRVLGTAPHGAAAAVAVWR